MQLLQWLALELSKKLGTNPDTGRADQSSDKERSPTLRLSRCDWRHYNQLFGFSEILNSPQNFERDWILKNGTDLLPCLLRFQKD